MLKNYFKISIRSLSKHKLFTTINVVGLAVGLASFLLIYEYTQFERSYDSFHPKADQLHRVSYVRISNGEIMDKDAMSAYPAGKMLQEGIPEVQLYTLSKQFDEVMVRIGNSLIRERSVITADENFLKLFDYEVLQGSKEEMLNEPNAVVLTKSRARAYFGDENPIGKTLETTGDVGGTLKVTGVIQDIPDNTHYRFDLMISDKTLVGSDDYDSWNYNNYYLYIRLAEGTDLKELTKKSNEVAYTSLNGEDRNRKSFNQLDIHPVQDIHLNSDFTYEPQLHGSKRAVRFLMIVSIFILVIAWVNYVNLSTARAAERAKEVGIRKVIGAFRKQLIIQFLCEALLVNLISALVALALAEWSLPFFNQLVGKEVIGHVWNHPPFLKVLLLFTTLGTFISGFYPAIVLSGFKPMEVLKGKFQNSNKGVFLRKLLVVLQFAASMVLIASTLIIYLQVHYMQSKDKGISLDYVINVYVPDHNLEGNDQQEAFDAKLQSFKEKLKGHRSILSVGGASN
ncbi:MAG: ABC transporter permease, partial [Bacteroidota bacterium]